jgi:hypothetical protein
VPGADEAEVDVWLSEIKGFDGTRPRTLTLYEGFAERYVKRSLLTWLLGLAIGVIAVAEQPPPWAVEWRPPGLLAAGSLQWTCAIVQR